MKSFADSLASAVQKTTKDWAAIKKKEERDRRSAARLREKYIVGRSLRTTIKEAAYAVIPEAYRKAGGGRYAVNARQLMYAARPAIQEATGQPLSDTYFTQTLLPDYMREHPGETADWDVVYDARGHLSEPHTQKRVNLGTLGVREYLREMKKEPDPGIEPPEFSADFLPMVPRTDSAPFSTSRKKVFCPCWSKPSLRSGMTWRSCRAKEWERRRCERSSNRCATRSRSSFYTTSTRAVLAS